MEILAHFLWMILRHWKLVCKLSFWNAPIFAAPAWRLQNRVSGIENTWRILLSAQLGAGEGAKMANGCISFGEKQCGVTCYKYINTSERAPCRTHLHGARWLLVLFWRFIFSPASSAQHYFYLRARSLACWLARRSFAFSLCKLRAPVEIMIKDHAFTLACSAFRVQWPERAGVCVYSWWSPHQRAYIGTHSRT